MTELNELTKQLFSDGYTETNYPDYIKGFNKFYGGFEYSMKYQQTMVFETGCGLLVKGSHWNCGYMSYMGIDWKVENDNPTIKCPFNRQNCPKNHPTLADHKTDENGLVYIVYCACHKVDKDYDYENSFDKAVDENRKREDELFLEFSKSKNDRVCRNQCVFNEFTQKWVMHYNPLECANGFCGQSHCNVFDIDFSGKKGNVFYDLKTVTESEKNGFFKAEKHIVIKKGLRLFDKPVKIEICQWIAKHPKAVYDKVKHNRDISTYIYWSQYHGKFFEYEVLNIRAEKRESRDLEQDLRDVAEGIKVIHASDEIDNQKQIKRERKQKSIETKRKRYLKMISESGLNGIESNYKYRVKRAIEKGIITDEEAESANAEYERRTIEKQMTLF